MTTKVNNRMITGEVWTLADLSDQLSIPNSSKWIGKQVFISDSNKPAFSSGVDTTSEWVDAQGAVLVTPA